MKFNQNAEHYQRSAESRKGNKVVVKPWNPRSYPCPRLYQDESGRWMITSETRRLDHGIPASDFEIGLWLALQNALGK